MPVRLRVCAWCLNLSFLYLADDGRNSAVPGFHLGLRNSILIQLTTVFMLLNTCEFIRIEHVKILCRHKVLSNIGFPN